MTKTFTPLIILTGLLFSCSTNKTEISNVSNLKNNDIIPIMIVNGDTLKPQNNLTDTIEVNDLYRVKMYLPVKEFFKSGIDILSGETKMRFWVIKELPLDEFEDVAKKYFTVKQDTGTIEISMDTIISKANCDSVFWTATIMKPDTAFALSGKWIIKR
jgi:hypothetical protein